MRPFTLCSRPINPSGARLIALCTALLAGSGQLHSASSTSMPTKPETAHLRAQPTSPLQAEAQARQLLALMTDEERFDLVCGNGLGIRGIPRLDIPPIHFADASAGLRLSGPITDYLEKTTAFPATSVLTAAWNPELTRAYAEAIGEEGRAGNIHFLLGPGMNFHRISVAGRNFEYFGEDPFLISRMIEAYVHGLQSTGVAATLKHFIGNEAEFQRRSSNTVIDERTLREIYMRPFEAGIRAGAWAVMDAYNLVNGEWAGESHYLNTELLRDALDFRWLIMSDWTSTFHGRQAAKSGLDLDMPRGKSLVNQRDDLLGSDAIDRMALSVLKTCIAAGFYGREQHRPELVERLPQHLEVARRTNHEGIVLLKNNGLLPLDAATDEPVRKILVTGNNAQRFELSAGGAAHVKGYDLITYVDALRDAFGDDSVTFRADPSKDDLRNANTVLVLTGFEEKGAHGEGERLDRSFALPEDELVLRAAQANPNTIVGIVSGGGVAMDWEDRVAGIFWLGYGGQTAPGAFVDILTGKISPSGKLPFTIERRFEDSPGFGYDQALPDRTKSYTAPLDVLASYHLSQVFTNEEQTELYAYDINYHEGVFVGYRWYDARDLDVRFPFGHGLSYSTFRYSDLQIEQDGRNFFISFNLENTGKREASEVAQVYVSPASSEIPRPPIELKGFQRVTLAPGASAIVSCGIGMEDLRYWNPELKGWTVDHGAYRISVGSSSRDLSLTQPFTFGE